MHDPSYMQHCLNRLLEITPREPRVTDHINSAIQMLQSTQWGIDTTYRHVHDWFVHFGNQLPAELHVSNVLRPDPLPLPTKLFPAPQPGEFLCKQCGLVVSAATGTNHMDRHFVLNRRQAHQEMNTAYRGWLLSADEWETMEDHHVAIASSPGHHVDNSMSVSSSAIPLNQVSTVQQRVLVHDQPARCHLCHDGFVQDFDQDEEEWYYRNCVQQQQKYYHEACAEIDQTGDN